MLRTIVIAAVALGSTLQARTVLIHFINTSNKTVIFDDESTLLPTFMKTHVIKDAKDEAFQIPQTFREIDGDGLIKTVLISIPASDETTHVAVAIKPWNITQTRGRSASQLYTETSDELREFVEASTDDELASALESLGCAADDIMDEHNNLQPWADTLMLFVPRARLAALM